MKKALLKLWNGYFDFTRGERAAFLILIVLTLGFSVYPMLGIGSSHHEKTDFSELIALAEKANRDSQERKGDEGTAFEAYPGHHAPAALRRFKFNPNTATVRELESLGFKTYIATRIDKYRLSGGLFRTRADLRKVYGINQELVTELWDEIELPETLEKPANGAPSKYDEKKTGKKPIDLNKADTLDLMGLPGIGSKLARRIVEFRSRLGGFYSPEQIREVYGLKPETAEQLIPQLTVSSDDIKLLDINAADAKTLEQHPYLDWNQANAIVQYRKQHGPYKSMDDLSKVVVLNELLLNKIKSYIKF